MEVVDTVVETVKHVRDASQIDPYDIVPSLRQIVYHVVSSRYLTHPVPLRSTSYISCATLLSSTGNSLGGAFGPWLIDGFGLAGVSTSGA